jgi:hypothetical protein
MGEKGGAPRSQDVSGVCVYSLPSFLFFSLLKWSLPSPFIDARGTPGYIHALRDIFPRKKDLRPPLLPCSWWRAAVGGVAPIL